MRLNQLNPQFKKEKVSTHAPVKDATHRKLLEKLFSEVSTHAPVKDATFVYYLQNDYEKFQPTHP